MQEQKFKPKIFHLLILKGEFLVIKLFDQTNIVFSIIISTKEVESNIKVRLSYLVSDFQIGLSLIDTRNIEES